ncbi:DUF6153 family protein [Streptomyces geranii]|uniref:DUF6153 family protein n=1 Tax=Streptomyces geranii TaxID=2058923 RepID=UPI000D0249DA|nr:DUF6153 family protein [Streptomyces geranii]
MPAAQVHRPTQRHAHGGGVRQLLGVLILVLAAFTFSCAGSLSAPDTGGSTSTSAHAAHVTDRDPCQESPHHGCHSPGHHGVLNHAPFTGADRAATRDQLSDTPAHLPLSPSQTPRGARPPDLHELQLLRV